MTLRGAACWWPAAAVIAAAAAIDAQAGAQPPVAPATAAHGRIESHDGLSIVRVWGTPHERGVALGRLLGRRIHHVVEQELTLRYARRGTMLDRVRELVAQRVRFPPETVALLEAMSTGLRASAVPLELAESGRDLDLLDLKWLNALDVVAQLGCTGFTASGPRVAGGGVLTARSFDWPLLGDHLLDELLLVVEHPEDAPAFASVTWPGYVGAITAVEQRGLAVFVHYGNAGVSWTPKDGAVPTALATRAILAAGPAGALAAARQALAATAPPAGFLTRVVLPSGPRAETVFEHGDEAQHERLGGAISVTSNHFLGIEGERGISLDSGMRFDAVTACLGEAQPIDAALAWRALAAAQRGEGFVFPTLHSLVYRAEPWCFELRIAARDAAGKLVPAPESPRRYAVPRGVLFRQP